MLNAGLIEYTVVDQPTGEFWAKVFPKIKLHRDITVATGQQIAWAFRKNTPQLQEAANKFLAKHGKGKNTGETILRRYLSTTKWAKSATNTKDRQRFDKTIAYFRKYGEKYGFDPLMLAAQGYQESGLNQNAKSHVGAIGVMQIMPATGKDLRVGNIHVEENNIHGGTKYMSQLASTYFDDPAIDAFNRTLFCFAGYNAGPGRVAGLRKTAEKLGFNPNVWFGNVETVASMKIGRETTQYVANISKYYIAYKLISEKASDGLNSEKQ
jgi:membrane-bound lytic murein transglycosylase MltF